MNDLSNSSETTTSKQTPNVIRTWADLLAYLNDHPDVDSVHIGPYYAAVKINSTLAHVGDELSGASIATDIANRLSTEERNERQAAGSIRLQQQHPGIGTLRIRVFSTNGADAAVITRFHENAPAIDPGIVSPAFLSAINRPSGIALIAAPHDSGLEAIHASVTQEAAMRNKDAIVAYIGSPPRYQLIGIRSLPIYIEVGPRKDQTRFSNAIAMASEEGANIIAVDGALETGEGAREALRAARGGALVIATVRAKTAVEALRHVHTLIPAVEREHWWSTFAQQFLAALALIHVPGRFPGTAFPAPDLLVNTPSLFAHLSAFDQNGIATHLAADREGSQNRDSVLATLAADVKISPETAITYSLDGERAAKRITGSR